MDVRVSPLPPEDNDAALVLWEVCVRATHHFVTEEHIQQYKGLVREALEERPLEVYGLYGPRAGAQGSLLAIMGVEPKEAMLGMLFVAADQRGRGYGRILVRRALELGVRKVDVNEQNLDARVFYERMGFVVRGVSPLDGVGNPYPLIHMELVNAGCADGEYGSNP